MKYLKIVRGASLPFIPASHESSSSPGVLKRVLGTKADFSAGRIQMLNWSLLAAGNSFREHFHEDMEEVFIIVSGSVVMQGRHSADEPFEEESLHAGDAVIVPPRVRHKMINASHEPAHYLVFGLSQETGGKTIVTE